MSSSCFDLTDPACGFGSDQSTIPTTESPGSSSSDWIAALGGSLSSITTSIFKGLNTPNTAAIGAAPTGAAPYPVVVNGQVVGYSSTPTQGTAGTTVSSGSILLLAVGAILVIVLIGRRRG